MSEYFQRFGKVVDMSGNCFILRKAVYFELKFFLISHTVNLKHSYLLVREWVTMSFAKNKV